MDAALARLRELALVLPRPGCEWEDRPRFYPPASAERVTAFEQAAGFPLPADVRGFLACADAVVGMSVHNGYLIGGTEVLTWMMTGGAVPRSVDGELAAPIATDGGGNAFLLSPVGHIRRWDHETGEVSPVADSFAAFLERVADDWHAYVTDRPGWRFLV